MALKHYYFKDLLEKEERGKNLNSLTYIQLTPRI